MLTPDTDSEAQYLRPGTTLKDRLIMGDRGYFKKAYLHEVDQHGRFYIVKGKANMTPTVLSAWTADGMKIKSWENKSLKELQPKLLKNQATDLDVEWPDKAGAICSRMIVSWNPEAKTYQYLMTNLPRDEFSVAQVLDAYRLRWQIELLFKEWKSYSNLHAFDTSNPHLAEGLIWAALCSAILKRYCAMMTQRMVDIPISTRKVAMCLYHVIPALFHCLLHYPRKFNSATRRLLEYLAKNPKRAHSK